MSAPMLEKLARALSRQRRDGASKEWLDRYVEADWPHRIYEVRAVLMALREPDEGMLITGHATMPDDEPVQDDVLVCWRAMIDHILNEPNP